MAHPCAALPHGAQHIRLWFDALRLEAGRRRPGEQEAWSAADIEKTNAGWRKEPEPFQDAGSVAITQRGKATPCRACALLS